MDLCNTKVPEKIVAFPTTMFDDLSTKDENSATRVLKVLIIGTNDEFFLTDQSVNKYKTFYKTLLIITKS